MPKVLLLEDGRREDRLPGGDAGRANGARGRPGHRLHQAGGDPGGDAASACPKPAVDRARALAASCARSPRSCSTSKARACKPASAPRSEARERAGRAEARDHAGRSEATRPPRWLRFVVERARGAGLAPLAGVGDGLLAVLPDDGGVAPAPREEAAQDLGLQARVVDRVAAAARGVIFLGGLREVATRRRSASTVRRSRPRARSPVERASGGVFVTVQDTGGDLGVSGSSGDRAWLAGLAALAKTAAEEWPRVVQARPRRRPRGDRIRRTSPRGSPWSCSRWRRGASKWPSADGRRTHAARGAGEGALGRITTPSRRATWCSSRAARGVTAACAVALAKAVKPRLVLIGRTPVAHRARRFHRHHGRRRAQAGGPRGRAARRCAELSRATSRARWIA